MNITKGIRPFMPEVATKNFLAEIAFPNEEVHVERRSFDINTYFYLRNNLDYWQRIQPANDFIATLDQDEYSYLVKLFIRAKRDLNQITDRESAMQAIAAIDEKVAKTFSKLNLSERLFSYVCQDKRITMPDLSEVGKRAQDTEEKTFREDEYYLINTIIVISKILFPIFGEIINRIQHVEDAYNGFKEIMAFGIINTLLSRDFDIIIKKLLNYIDIIVGDNLPSDPMLVFHGMTKTTLTYDKLAKMVVKNFVNHDLYKPGGNVMTYLIVTIKRAIDMDTTGKNTYQMRHDPETGEDGSNISYLENSVNVIGEPIETSIIVKIAVDKFTKDYVKQNGIRMRVFEAAESFYKVTSLPPTVLNEQLVAMFVADPIGSAYCVKYMNMDMMVRLIIILQIYAIRMGFREVVPLLSMIPTGVIKTHTDEIDNHLIISDGRGDGPINYYLNLREATVHLDDFSNFNFAELMKGLIMFVVGGSHTFNVAPSILELGDTGNTKNVNGIVKYDKNIISELYRFMYHLLQADKDRKIIIS